MISQGIVIEAVPRGRMRKALVRLSNPERFLPPFDAESASAWKTGLGELPAGTIVWVCYDTEVQGLRVVEKSTGETT